jgi:hypothetical protein
MNEFREISIPGDVLDDDRLTDMAKILYGKISRLAYKNGYCWASNKFLDGTKSGNTASRNIKELEKYEYVKCVYENFGQDRKIYICSIDSRVKKNPANPPPVTVTPPPQMVRPLTAKGEAPSPKMVRPLTANGEAPSPQMVNEHYKLNIQKEQEEEQPKKTEEHFSLSEELNPNLGDFSQRLKILQEHYNELDIGPPFKKTSVNLNSSESSDLMKIMQTYRDNISLKAMDNYSEIKNSQEHDPGGCVYRGFVSFMVRGVEKYCDEAKPFELFRKKRTGPSPPDERFNEWSNFGEKG